MLGPTRALHHAAAAMSSEAANASQTFHETWTARRTKALETAPNVDDYAAALQTYASLMDRMQQDADCFRSCLRLALAVMNDSEFVGTDGDVMAALAEKASQYKTRRKRALELKNNEDALKRVRKFREVTESIEVARDLLRM